MDNNVSADAAAVDNSLADAEVGIGSGLEEEEDSWVIVEKQIITILVPPPSPVPKHHHQTTSPRTDRIRTKSRNVGAKGLQAPPRKKIRKVARAGRRKSDLAPSEFDPQIDGNIGKTTEAPHGSNKSCKITGFRGRIAQESAQRDGNRVVSNGGCPNVLPPVGAVEVVNLRLRAANLERRLARLGGLRRWLMSLGLAQFVRMFETEKFDKFRLVGLTMGKLKDMGADAVGPRRKLIHAIDCISKPYFLKSL